MLYVKFLGIENERLNGTRKWLYENLEILCQTSHDKCLEYSLKFFLFKEEFRNTILYFFDIIKL